MTEKSDLAFTRQWIQQTDEKHEAGHTRLRLDYRELERRVMAVERAYTDTLLDFTRTKAEVIADRRAPIDVGKIVGNWKSILIIAGVIATNLAGNWFSNSPVRESQLELQKSFIVMQTQIDGDSKLKNAQTNAIKDSVDNLNRQMEMRRLEIQALSNDLQQLRRAK